MYTTNRHLAAFVNIYSYNLASENLGTKSERFLQALNINCLKAVTTYCPIVSTIFAVCVFIAERKTLQAQHRSPRKIALVTRLSFNLLSCGILLLPVDVLGTIIKVILMTQRLDFGFEKIFLWRKRMIKSWPFS